MSIFDDPFDAGIELLRTGCVCGNRSAAEHDQATSALRCEVVANPEQRYQSVVASAVTRAMFPKNGPFPEEQKQALWQGLSRPSTSTQN
jgi:nitrate/nitrite transport system substrate-binding protein